MKKGSGRDRHRLGTGFSFLLGPGWRETMSKGLEATSVLPVLLRQYNTGEGQHPTGHICRTRSNLCSLVYIIKGVGGKGLKLSQ